MTQQASAIARPSRLMLTLAISDFRNIWRDGLLAFLILLPLFIALIYRLLIPDQQELEAMVRSRLPADLEPYRATLTYAASAMEKLLMGIFIGMSPGLVGAVYGLLLVDERDQRTLAVLRVMPIAFAHYLAARLATPCILSILVTIGAYPLAGLAPLPVATVVAIGFVGATTVPVVVLSIVTFASTKVGALVVMRLVNGALALPFLAYFASPLQELLAWPVPSFWQMKALWLASGGEPYLWALALTPAINIPLAVWLYSRFAKRNE